MSNRYEAVTFDVCAQGSERLRILVEFILLAYIGGDTDSGELLGQWESVIQACARPDGFDYDAALECVRAFYLESVAPLFQRKANPFSLEPANEDDDSSESCVAFLFIRDTQA